MNVRRLIAEGWQLLEAKDLNGLNREHEDVKRKSWRLRDVPSPESYDAAYAHIRGHHMDVAEHAKKYLHRDGRGKIQKSLDGAHGELEASKKAAADGDYKKAIHHHVETAYMHCHDAIYRMKDIDRGEL